MAIVKAFSGWRYNKSRFKKIQDVVVPPYDVISEQELAELKKKDHNFSQVILPGGENKHQTAANVFHQWQKEESFIQDQKPTLYFYKQTFHLTRNETFCQELPTEIKQGGTLSRTGILCRVGLEDYAAKIILPHEKTFSGPKADRYKLMEAAQGNMEPVFLGYDSERFSGDEFEKICLTKTPEYEFTDDPGVKHQLWLITDEKVHQEVSKALEAKKFYILDGHHRYETALKFYRDHQKSDAKLDHRYVLANICSFNQPGTIILPTHRAVKGLNHFDGRKWLAALASDYDVTPGLNLDGVETLLKEKPNAAFAVRLQGEKSYNFIHAKKSTSGKLDLEVLHHELMATLDRTQQEENFDTSYIKDIRELENGVDTALLQIGFLVRPSTTEEVMTVAENSKVMPHKSTFFYPKIPSGLVVNTFT